MLHLARCLRKKSSFQVHGFLGDDVPPCCHGKPLTLLVTCVFTATLTWIPWSRPVAGQSQPAKEALLERLDSSRGDAYLAARSELLALDRGVARELISAKRKAAQDPIQQLVLEALAAHLADTKRLGDGLQAAMAEAAKDRSQYQRNPYNGPTPPEPFRGGQELLVRLGDDAAPLAAEYLTKDLTADWEESRKLVLIHVLRFFGAERRYLDSSSGDGRLEDTQIKDARAGQVVLRFVQDAKEDTARDATWVLCEFSSPDLAKQISELQSATVSDQTRRRLRELEARLAGEARSRAQWASTATDAVTCSLPFRFSLDPERKLSTEEKKEFDRLCGILRDSKASLSQRKIAAEHLGTRVAHTDCIAPLQSVCENDKEPLKLRGEAIRSLACIPQRAVVPILIARLADSEGEIRDRARHYLVMVTKARKFGGVGLQDDPERWRRGAEVAVKWWSQCPADFPLDRKAVLVFGYWH